MTKYEDCVKNIKGCPFCEKSDRVIIESSESFMTYALWPYHKHHLLIIPKRHIESLSKLTEIEKKDIDSMQEKALEILKKLGYSSITHLVREGKENKAINHVHFHTIPNIRIGDLDHYGQERKMLLEDDIQKTIKDIQEFL